MKTKFAGLSKKIVNNFNILFCNMIKEYADVVGMTLASEATLACELGLRYASICSVDNYAHGLINKKLDFEEVIEGAKDRVDDLIMLINAVVEEIKCY